MTSIGAVTNNDEHCYTFALQKEKRFTGYGSPKIYRSFG